MPPGATPVPPPSSRSSYVWTGISLGFAVVVVVGPAWLLVAAGDRSAGAAWAAVSGATVLGYLCGLWRTVAWTLAFGIAAATAKSLGPEGASLLDGKMDASVAEPIAAAAVFMLTWLAFHIAVFAPIQRRLTLGDRSRLLNAGGGAVLFAVKSTVLVAVLSAAILTASDNADAIADHPLGASFDRRALHEVGDHVRHSRLAYLARPAAATDLFRGRLAGLVDAIEANIRPEQLAVLGGAGGVGSTADLTSLLQSLSNSNGGSAGDITTGGLSDDSLQSLQQMLGR